MEARLSRSARDAEGIFAKWFGKTLDDLALLYENPNWRDAKAWGGHAWRQVTATVAKLGQTIRDGHSGEIAAASEELLRAHHNNGFLYKKIAALDSEIGAKTDAWWLAQQIDHEL